MLDLDRPKQRMSMYRTVLAEGQADDLVTLLNRDLLMAQWPVLRSLISRAIRDVSGERLSGACRGSRPCCRVRLTDLHRRLLADVLEIGSGYPLVITGGYAVQAHGLADRLSQDLDVATEHPAPMPDIVTTLAEGLSARNWHVRVIGADPLSGRLVATDSVTGEECEVDVLKEAFWFPPQAGEWGPVLALDDVIGTKVRALADRVRGARSHRRLRRIPYPFRC